MFDQFANVRKKSFSVREEATEIFKAASLIVRMIVSVIPCIAIEHGLSPSTLPPPFASYFKSSSPKDSTISLSQACNESRRVAQKRYSLILPHSSTCFSFPKDFPYLVWGRFTTVPYHPQHFASSPWPGDSWAHRYERPEIIERVASQVRNLAVYNRFAQRELSRADTRPMPGRFLI